MKPEMALYGTFVFEGVKVDALLYLAFIGYSKE